MKNICVIDLKQMDMSSLINLAEMEKQDQILLRKNQARISILKLSLLSHLHLRDLWISFRLSLGQSLVLN